MQKAEIKKMAVSGQPDRKSLQDPISVDKNCPCWHMPVIPAITGSLR
jgi:hypothetical protein